MIWQLRCWCFLLSVRTGGRFSVIFSTISCCQPFSCLKYAANVKSDKQVLTTGTAKTSCPLLSMSKIQAYRRPASSVGGACGRCAEALSSPQRPTVWVRPAALRCVSSPLSLIPISYHLSNCPIKWSHERPKGWAYKFPLEGIIPLFLT